ncbi:MAG: class I SAM-dependent methyltransferase [Pseudomonadota bacterium]
MNWYERNILPRILDTAMNQTAFRAIRETMVSQARGRILEIGMGSGLNIPHYRQDVQHLVALEPSEKLRTMAASRAQPRSLELEFIGLSGESIPVEDNQFDDVVITWTLCTIPDHHQALAEIRRVLKPGGRMIFSEHGLAPEPSVQKWQHRINPFWNVICGGCNLNREPVRDIEQAGFKVDVTDASYIPGPRWATWTTRGIGQVR